MEKKYTEINSVTWDSWDKEGNIWTIPISHEEYINATKGEWGIYLTPCKTVPKDWFGELKDKKVLGLASGGGQQMPLLSALGAQCTVFDFSESQLEKERIVSKREGYTIEIIKGDMTEKLPFEDNTFDLIVHPVSNCYVEDVYHVFTECYRVLKIGGILLSGLDNGINYLFDDNPTEPLVVKHKLPFNPLKMSKEQQKKMIDNNDGIQFSHSIEEQIGGQLKAGLTLIDIYDDKDRDGILQKYIPQYYSTKSIKLK